jgi:phosphonate transport system substrate-binding protein
MSCITELLAEDMGENVEPVYARSPSHLEELLAEGEADFGWLSPTLLLMAPMLSTMVPLLSAVRHGAAFYHSIVFAPADSPVHSVEDLRDAHAAWVAPTSASGYLVPRLTLARCGVDSERALERETFCDSHGAVADLVFHGEAAIGGTYAHFEGGDPEAELLRTGYSDAPERSDARILAVSGPIPADMIVAHPFTPIPTRIAFAASLCRLVHDPVGAKPIDQIIGAEDFRPVGIDMLEELQGLMAAAAKLL